MKESHPLCSLVLEGTKLVLRNEMGQNDNDSAVTRNQGKVQQLSGQPNLGVHVCWFL